MKNENLRSNELRYQDALPYLRWLVNALDNKLPENWTNQEEYLECALVNAKEYIKVSETK